MRPLLFLIKGYQTSQTFDLVQFSLNLDFTKRFFTQKRLLLQVNFGYGNSKFKYSNETQDFFTDLDDLSIIFEKRTFYMGVHKKYSYNFDSSVVVWKINYKFTNDFYEQHFHNKKEQLQYQLGTYVILICIYVCVWRTKLDPQRIMV